MQLIIQQFFDRIESELGYKPDIEKYFDFINLLIKEDMPATVEERKKCLYGFARFLFCERERDEPRFKQIFDVIFEKERAELDQIAKVEKEEEKIEKKEASSKKNTDVIEEEGDDELFYEEPETKEIPTPWTENVPDKYLNFKTELTGSASSNTNKKKEAFDNEYVYSNDYHIISFREMIQSWRYFRLTQPLGFSDEPDVPALIQQVAQDGMFTEMKYKKAFVNREDSLLIFADRRGSMAPFHGLVDSLVKTAKREGGHHKAQVYYFQNYALDYVYANPHFTHPKRVDAVLSKVSQLHSYVMIISDAGASKGHLNKGRIAATGFIEQANGQYEMDRNSFLSKLLRLTKDVVWLNPMPRDRWKGTSAEIIAQMPAVKMYSLHDSNRLGFTFAVKDLLYEG